MDFGALPPEINSARMYTGPGSAPMMAAASAWDGLAAELHSAAAQYQAVITSLTNEGWMGPASTAMAAALAPYVLWMHTTAGQAEHTAAQAKSAAAAYEAAHAMTVPPPAVTANRVQLQVLTATNFLGQNAAAIAATEAQYGAMWAQDAAAMYGYAGTAAAATKVTPFSAAPQTVNPAGQNAQDAAVAQSAGSASSSAAQSTLSQAISATPTALQGLSSPVESTTPGTALTKFLGFFGFQPGDLANASSNLMSSSFSPMGLAGVTQAAADIAVVRGAAIAAGDPFGLGGGLHAMSPLGSLGGLMPGIGVSAVAPVSSVAAGLGQGSLVGALSVPPSWAGAAPVAAPSAPASLVASWAPAPAAPAGGAPGMPGMPLAGAGGGRGIGFAAPRYGFKLTVMGRPVVAG